jgi:hypothetical protein
MQQSNTTSTPEEELSMPTKITDCIFMSDDVIAHVKPLSLRISNG